MTMMMRSLARKGAIALCAVAVLAMMSGKRVGSMAWLLGMRSLCRRRHRGRRNRRSLQPAALLLHRPRGRSSAGRGDACAGSSRRNDALPCVPGIRSAALLLPLTGPAFPDPLFI